jgi:hypothetical protein
MEIQSILSVHIAAAVISNFLKRIADIGCHFFLLAVTCSSPDLRDRLLQDKALAYNLLAVKWC